MNLLVRLATAGLLKATWVSTLHSHPDFDFLSSRFKSYWLPRLNRWTLWSTAGVFVVNREFCSVLPGKSCFFVPNGADIKPLGGSRETYRQQLRERLGVPPCAPLVGAVARLDPVKGLATFIRSVAYVEDKQVHFVLVGDGPDRDRLERLAMDLGVAARVHFSGFIQPPYETYAGLDLNVLPSLREGMGYSILEAGILGVPTVGSDISGVRQLIATGTTGMLFPVGDAQALAAAIDWMLGNRHEANRMVEAFHRTVVPNYTPEAMLSAYLNGYEQLTAMRGRQTQA